MNPKICISIMADTFEDFISLGLKAQEKADIIEIRADAMPFLDKDSLFRFKSTMQTPCIYTCRSASEGGLFTGTENERYTFIREGIDAGFSYVDIELNTLKKKYFDTKRSKLIASYHNLQNTPNITELERIIEESQDYYPSIIKIATTINEDSDCNVLYKLLLSKTNDIQYIVIGMGEKGSKTRFIAPFLGSFLTFASFEGKSSASGQIDIDIMRNLFSNFYK